MDVLRSTSSATPAELMGWQFRSKIMAQGYQLRCESSILCEFSLSESEKGLKC